MDRRASTAVSGAMDPRQAKGRSKRELARCIECFGTSFRAEGHIQVCVACGAVDTTSRIEVAESDAEPDRHIQTMRIGQQSQEDKNLAARQASRLHLMSLSLEQRRKKQAKLQGKMLAYKDMTRWAEIQLIFLEMLHVAALVWEQPLYALLETGKDLWQRYLRLLQGPPADAPKPKSSDMSGEGAGERASEGAFQIFPPPQLKVVTLAALLWLALCACRAAPIFLGELVAALHQQGPLAYLVPRLDAFTRKPRELMLAREDGPRYKEVAEALHRLHLCGLAGPGPSAHSLALRLAARLESSAEVLKSALTCCTLLNQGGWKAAALQLRIRCGTSMRPDAIAAVAVLAAYYMQIPRRRRFHHWTRLMKQRTTPAHLAKRPPPPKKPRAKGKALAKAKAKPWQRVRKQTPVFEMRKKEIQRGIRMLREERLEEAEDAAAAAAAAAAASGAIPTADGMAVPVEYSSQVAEKKGTELAAHTATEAQHEESAAVVPLGKKWELPLLPAVEQGMFARKLTESCAFLRPKAESDLVERLQNGMLELEEEASEAASPSSPSEADASGPGSVRAPSPSAPAWIHQLEVRPTLKRKTGRKQKASSARKRKFWKGKKKEEEEKEEEKKHGKKRKRRKTPTEVWCLPFTEHPQEVQETQRNQLPGVQKRIIEGFKAQGDVQFQEFQDGRSAEVSAAAQFKRKLAMVTQIFLGAEIYQVHKDTRMFFGCRAQHCARWMNAEERRVIRGNLQLWGRATGASGARESNRVIRPTGTAVSSLMLDHQQRLC